MHRVRVRVRVDLHRGPHSVLMEASEQPRALPATYQATARLVRVRARARVGAWGWG